MRTMRRQGRGRAMNAAMKRAAAGRVGSVVALVAGCRTPPPAPATPASAGAAPPPWLVTIVVDQLAAWMADERWPALPSDGGFARLLREGLYVRELRFAHAVTETAPGHAALYTGAVPRATGIVANDVLGPDGKKVSSLLDANTRLVPAGAAGPIDRQGSSLAALQVDTLADALVAARPGAEVYSFSLKDRGALFGAGRHPKLALWLDTEGGTLVTSTAFATSVPAWAAPFADAAAVARAFAPAVGAAGRGLAGGERRRRATTRTARATTWGMGIVFPHQRDVGEGDARDAGGRSPAARARARGRHARRRDRGGAAGAAGAVAVVARLRRPRVRARQLGGVGRAAPPRSRARRAVRGAGRAGRDRPATRSC